jgi:hypothetical protein
VDEDRHCSHDVRLRDRPDRDLAPSSGGDRTGAQSPPLRNLLDRRRVRSSRHAKQCDRRVAIHDHKAGPPCWSGIRDDGVPLIFGVPVTAPWPRNRCVSGSSARVNYRLSVPTIRAAQQKASCRPRAAAVSPRDPGSGLAYSNRRSYPVAARGTTGTARRRRDIAEHAFNVTATPGQ